MRRNAEGFSIASFDFNGRYNGTVQWRFDALSQHWLSVCREFLGHNGDSFKASWTGPLAHLATHFTSASGSAMLTSRVDDEIALSSVLIGGLSREADQWVLDAFLTSMRGVDLVRGSAPDSEPFRELLAIEHRPLMATVFWGNPRVTDQDYELVVELERHLAGVFFSPQQPG
ncbi:MAG TPA: hypothetical protein VEC11_05015 [Allosphingosinicella sp.]|nr:hypothetical protein [Allosphingosinicella sp.]